MNVLLVNILLRLQAADQGPDVLFLRVNRGGRFGGLGFSERTIEVARRRF